MIAFIARRIIQAALVMLAVAFIAFSMFSFVGDPVRNIVSQDATLEQIKEVRKNLGLDDPMPVRIGRFVVNAVQGNFGLSYRTTEPAGKMIAQRLPATIELSIVADIFALFAGIPMGVFAGLYR